METPVKQLPKHLEPYKFKPGQSGNPNGRPKGPTLKEWAQEQIKNMPDDERIEFLRRIPPEVIWRMAEGNPSEDKKISITVPKPILGGTTALPEATQKELKDELTHDILDTPSSNSDEIVPETAPLDDKSE